MCPTLQIFAAGGRGLDRILVEFDSEDRERGLALLRKTIPVLENLDRVMSSPEFTAGPAGRKAER